jgi:hypothetical protein
MPVTHSPFAGGIGIEGISWQPHESGLPGGTQVVPSGDMPGHITLEALYGSPLEEGLRAFLKPNLNTRELLFPGYFSARLNNARKKLRAAARKSNSPACAKAAELLEEDAELKELLSMFRGLLQKG